MVTSSLTVFLPGLIWGTDLSAELEAPAAAYTTGRGYPPPLSLKLTTRTSETPSSWASSSAFCLASVMALPLAASCGAFGSSKVKFGLEISVAPAYPTPARMSPTLERSRILIVVDCRASYPVKT